MKKNWISIENKYTLKCLFAIEIQICQLFTLVWVTSVNKLSCKYFSIKCSYVYIFLKIKIANNLYLMVRSGSEFYISVNFRFHQLLISVENMNLLPSSIYKHLKTNLIKHEQSLIFGEYGSQLQCSKFPIVRSSMTTKNDYERPEFVTKLPEWRPEIFFYPDAEIYSFQVLWVDFSKLSLKMAINIKLFN